MKDYTEIINGESREVPLSPLSLHKDRAFLFCF